VIGSSERFYPGRLPDLLGPFLAGDRVDEPFELLVLILRLAHDEQPALLTCRR